MIDDVPFEYVIQSMGLSASSVVVTEARSVFLAGSMTWVASEMSAGSGFTVLMMSLPLFSWLLLVNTIRCALVLSCTAVPLLLTAFLGLSASGAV
jgi:hypothetical protein